MPRDAILSDWRFEDAAMGDDYAWGCGYPGDAQTQRWMKDNVDPIFGWPDVVRFSWGPALEVSGRLTAHGTSPSPWLGSPSWARRCVHNVALMAPPFLPLSRAQVLQKEPRKHGACEVRWPAEEGEEASQMQQQRDGMASFLGLKRRKVDRHRMIEECLLEPVESF